MVTVDRNRFLLDGKPFYLYSGEIHYFRIAPARWEIHLRAARRAGLNTVSSYVPWIWHEPQEGNFDFHGDTDPRRDLDRFLRLVHRHRLKFLARVGPVSNAELVNEGVPGWLVDEHPEVYVRGREITNLPHTTLLSYLNDTFQAAVGRWYEQVLPLVREHAHPDGPVILVQLDNEIGMVHWLQKAADYSPATEERFAAFLERHYRGDLSKLNLAYRTRHVRFADVRQPASGHEREGMPRLWDWMAFYREYYAEYFGTLLERYRAAGLELPVMANIPQFYDFDVRGRGVYSPMTTLMFREFAVREPRVVLGGAYQLRHLDHENFHDIAVATEVVRMISGPEAPVVCAELQTGLLRDRPRLYPQDVELNLKSSAAQGLNGLNAYMFSGGRNEPGLGAFGTYHEWQAAVAADGTPRAHYAALADFGRQLRSFGTLLAGTRKRSDVTLGFYAPYWATEYLSGPNIEEWEWKKHHLFFDGLARLVPLAGMQYKLLDLERAGPAELEGLPALVVFALEVMDAGTQAKLAAYVRGGGRLLLTPDLPTLDAGLEPCTLLADALGVGVGEKRTRGLGFRIGRQDYLAQGGLVCLSPGRAEVLARTLDGRPCAVLARARRGRALVAGVGLSHVFDYQIGILAGWLARLGVEPSIAAEGELALCLRENEDHGFLFAANYHDVPVEGRARLVLPGETRPSTLPARGRLRLGPRRGYVLPLNLPLAGGERLRYATAEVLEAGSRGAERRLVVTGAAGAGAEVELVTAARGVRLDGRRLPARRAGRRLRVTFELSGAPQVLTAR